MTPQRVTIEPLDNGGVVLSIAGCRVGLIIPRWALIARPNRYVKRDQ